MRTQIIIYNTILLFLCCPMSYADEIVFNNKEVIEGNIISVDEEGNIRIDVVLDSMDIVDVVRNLLGSRRI